MRRRERGGEAAHTGANLGGVERREAEEQALHVAPLEPVPVERHCVDPVRGGGRLGLAGREPADDPRRGVQPRLDGRNLQQPLQVSGRRLAERGEPGAIELAHAADMPAEVALGDEVAEDGLVQRRRVPIGVEAQREQGLQQRRWDHHVAQAQRGEEDLAEAPEEDDAVAPVQALERRDGPAGKAILAVVVVLDHARAGLARPVEDSQAALDRQRCPQRELVGGREVDGLRPGGALDPPGDVETVRVYRHGDEPGPGVAKCGGGARVARILEPDRITRSHEQARQEIEGLLDAGDDDDLIDGAPHTARAAEVGRDGLPERRVAADVAQAEQRARRPSQAASRDAGPELDWELVQRRLEGMERAEGRGRGDTREWQRTAGAWARRLPEVLGDLVADPGPRADSARHVALGLELLEDGDDGAARDTVLPREVTGGGQSRAAPEPPLEDRGAERLVQPLGQGPPRWAGGQREIEATRVSGHG